MTAVEKVFNELEEQGLIFLTTKTNEMTISISASDYLDIKRLAKEMEKQQIIDAQSYAISNADMTNNRGYFDSNKWYNETYGSNSVNPNLSEIPTSSQTEISDEEIEKFADEELGTIRTDFDFGVIQGMKWYREQLKQRQ